MQNLSRRFATLAEADAWVASCVASGDGWMRWGVWERRDAFRPEDAGYLAIVQRVKPEPVKSRVKPQMARFDLEADAVGWADRMKRSGYAKAEITHDGDQYLVKVS